MLFGSAKERQRPELSREPFKKDCGTEYAWLWVDVARGESGYLYVTQTGVEVMLEIDLFTFQLISTSAEEIGEVIDSKAPEERRLFWLESQDRIQNIAEMDAFCSDESFEI